MGHSEPSDNAATGKTFEDGNRITTNNKDPKHAVRSSQSSRDGGSSSMAPDNPAGPAASTEETYPEGGLVAWLSVFGSLCGMMCCFGLMNTIGTFQAYLVTHQLGAYSQASVGWIFGLYLFVAYFSGVQTGPIFDATGPKALMVAGSICLVACILLLAVCTAYWHFILVFSILGGLGTSLVSTPCIGSIGHHFKTRRGFATGIASCGGSIGGIIFPLMLTSLFIRTGFDWATRALGLLFLLLLSIANALIRSDLPRRSISKQAFIPDLRIFKDTTFLVMTIAIFLVEWGLFVPLTYLTSFALSAKIRPALAYQLLAILNTGSFFGRWAPGLLADIVGRFNTMILMIILCFLTVFAFWLPAALTAAPSSKEALSIVFALLFGFASGSNISLGPVCAGQLCKTEDYGKYFATCYTVVGIGTLVGIPIAGEILNRDRESFVGLIVFAGVCYAAGLGFFVWARIKAVGWGWGREHIY